MLRLRGDANMHKAVRTQEDDLGDIYSQQTALDMSGFPDRARQEFKDEADINILLRRFGVTVPQKQVTYGEANFDLDLQQAHAAVREAKEGFARLPEELRKKYPSWKSIFNAIQSGELKDLKSETVPEPEKAPEPAP